MAWTTPMTATTNAVLTAAQWNASVRDNLNETAVAKATASGSYFVGTGTNSLAQRFAVTDTVLTSETYGSASYGDLVTPGPALTFTSGTNALVLTSSLLSNSTAGAHSYMTVEVTGASTVATNDNRALMHTSAAANAWVSASYVALYVLTAGSNTFTSKYRVNTGTGTFNNRRITAMPF